MKMSYSNILTSFLLFITFSRVYSQVGQSCTLRTTGASGVCKLSCFVAEEEAKRGIRPTLCGYQDETPIICCEEGFVKPNVLLNNNEDVIRFPESSESDRPASNRRKSEEKCEEYNKQVTSNLQINPLIAIPDPQNYKIEKCTYISVALIVGGKAAQPGQFPYMAAVYYNTSDNGLVMRCGGSLISERYVLTAAHCTVTRENEVPTVVRLGDLDLSSTDDGSEEAEYLVQDIITHPQWRYNLKYHDIALLRLIRRVSFTKFIRPACLNTKVQLGDSAAIATGWGKTDFATIESNSVLMRVKLNLYDNSVCERAYGTANAYPQGISSKMMCAGELKGGKDTCQGDSGGPLVITEKRNSCKFYVVGVTSFGKSCGQVNTPAVYTRVSEYIDWIENTIW